ncbi:MAG: deoxynucleoside kinase [Candidatus Aenigmarchaeota archaeon]|nr:deoxynucleoside kinase [Candidatus Aenigmarchaeota archaeon]
MSFIIAFVGLPASGKSFFSKKIAEKFGYPLFEEPATQILSESSYISAGFRLPYEFDERVFEMNRRRIEETSQLLSKTPVVWESHMLTDATFLMGRAFFGDRDPKRFKLLQKYQSGLMNELKEKTIFVILDIDPEISLQKQKERGNPRLLTPDLKLLKYVRNSFLNFYKKNKKNSILIDVTNKSEKEVLKEIESKLREKIEELKKKLENN